MAIGGVAIRESGEPLIFFDCKPETRELGPVSIGKVGRKVMADIASRGFGKVYAEVDDADDRAKRFIKWLGFRHIGGEVYVHE